MQPLLIAGYGGLKENEKAIPDEDRRERMAQAVQRLIDLALAMDKPDDVKRWQAELANYPAQHPVKTPDTPVPGNQARSETKTPPEKKPVKPVNKGHLPITFSIPSAPRAIAPSFPGLPAPPRDHPLQDSEPHCFAPCPVLQSTTGVAWRGQRTNAARRSSARDVRLKFGSPAIEIYGRTLLKDIEVFVPDKDSPAKPTPAKP